jgi:hypothetical protein
MVEKVNPERDYQIRDIQNQILGAKLNGLSKGKIQGLQQLLDRLTQHA